MSTLQVELVAADRKVWEGPPTRSRPGPSTVTWASRPATNPSWPSWSRARCASHHDGTVGTAVIDNGFLSVNKDVDDHGRDVDASNWAPEGRGPQVVMTALTTAPRADRPAPLALIVLTLAFIWLRRKSHRAAVTSSSGRSAPPADSLAGAWV